jgi:hypothetical protein
LLAALLVVGFWPRILTDIIQKSVATSVVSTAEKGGVEAPLSDARRAAGTAAPTPDVAKASRP